MRTILFFIVLIAILSVGCNKQVASQKQVATVVKKASGAEKEVTFKVGQSYCGGIIFYIDSTGKHGLIAPSFNVLYGTWGCLDNRVKVTKSAIGTGKANTEAILKVCKDTSSAARLCSDLVLNGYDDWFLPSKDELDTLYARRSLFRKFETNYFWSSTEAGDHFAECQDFYDGHQMQYEKNNTFYVRAIRAF